jgi:hypothetical protein
MTAFWDIAPSSRIRAIALMMEAVRISETSVYFNETHGATSQETHLHSRCLEDLKCHVCNGVCVLSILCIVPLLRWRFFYSCEQFKGLKRWRMHVIHVIGLCHEWERAREFRRERKNGMCLWCCAICIEALIRFLRRKEQNEKPSSGMLSSFV